ncbi:YdcH family protein [Luteimonas vadosa]|uniref:YdcH family protein n=1 Tax=Luteimonas vadosa TaxID=1165507 RepID=A0ABP9DUE7_9GAMM
MQPIGPSEQSRLIERLVALRVEHRDLDAAIARLQTDPQADELAVKRLKKRKLQLKDCIERLESALIPDEPA